MALSCSSNDTRNFESVTVASVDVIKLPLRDILDRHIKPRDLYHKITSCSTLNLRPEQKTICLIPPPDLPDYNTFDVTLLYTLIRNLCPLPCPKRGWGNKPEALDIQISDDIERLRLFRNNYYAHANSAAISDHMFKNIWRDLKQTFTRIESKYKLDYKDELLRIEQSTYTHSHWKECMFILNAYASRQKETDETPDIIIHGENEIICGGTAQFEADVKKVESSCWSVAWQKQRGDVIERINTRMERYSGSTKKKLVIKTVCKEDEGEYQAVLSLESNGPYFTSRNTIRLHVLGGLPNITTSLDTNVKTRSVKLTANIYFYDDSPGIFETFWTKNDKKINPEESGKVLSEMTTHNPSLTIRNVGPDDAGEYQLTAINDVGSSTSDVIILGIPSVFAKNIEENDEGLRITVTIKSLPSPCHVQWSAKRKDDENFTLIDINTEEYKGTTISFPHPVLVVRQKDELEKNCFQITVTNFIGKTVQEISGNHNPAVSKNTDTVRNTVYTDLNASVRFMKLNNILAEQFPCQKVETLKFLLTSSNKVKPKNSVLDAKSAMDCLKILQDEKLFTPTDVIFMQFLCRETRCLELYDKCKDYAEKQEALCFFEKRSVNGYVDVQFHVQGDLSRYTKEYLQDVIKTVAAIVDCKEEDILLKSIEHSESFLLSLALKDVYILKMFALKEQDRLKLRKLNIDFFIIHKETIHLEKAKGVGEREKRIVKRSSYDTKMAENHQISMQMVTSAQHFLECGNEGCGKNCQFYCNQCHRKLCEECKDEHPRNPMTRHHEVVLFNQRKCQLPVKKCTLHPTRNIDILCKECNVPLCSKCTTMKNHLGHTFNDLEDIFAGKFESNGKKISEIQGYFLPTAQELKKETEEDAKEIKMIMDSIRDSIKDEAESLKSLVDKATSEKLEHANLIEDSLHKQLKPQETTYKEYVAYLERLVGDFRGNFPITDGGGLSAACSLEVKPIPETTKPNLPKYRFGQFSKDNVGKLLGSIVVPSVKEEKRKIKPMEKDSSSSQLNPAGAQGELEQRADAIKRPIVSEVRAFKVPGVYSTWYLSVDKSGRVWASDDGGNLVQTDPEGNQLQKIQTNGKDEGYHTVTPTGDLLYTDKIKRIINKIPQNNRISKFFKTEDWEPLSIHSSHINGDVLVGMRKDREAKVTRYKNGKEIQNIQMDKKRQAIYNSPLYITENINGDICASDDEKQAVVVVSKAGQHRFSYRGQEPEFHPYGICTDCSGNILISVGLLSNGTVVIISQDGHFLSRLFAMDQEIKSSRCVCVSDKNNLYVGQEMSNKVKVFKYEFK